MARAFALHMCVQPTPPMHMLRQQHKNSTHLRSAAEGPRDIHISVSTMVKEVCGGALRVRKVGAHAVEYAVLRIPPGLPYQSAGFGVTEHSTGLHVREKPLCHPLLNRKNKTKQAARVWVVVETGRI